MEVGMEIGCDSQGINEEQADMEMVERTRIPRVPLKFTTSATLQVGGLYRNLIGFWERFYVNDFMCRKRR